MNIENTRFGLDILDELLPQGVPRNSFIILAGSCSIGKTFLALEIVRQFLLRKEPVIYVVFDDDPITIIDIINNRLGIDVYSYTRDRLLNIVDGFSFRIKDKRGRTHISVAEEVTPENTEQIVYTIIQLVDRLEIKGRGIIVIDSLNEILAYHEYIKIIELIKNIRANISKYRCILTLAILHISSEETKKLLQLIEYGIDGLIYMNSTYKDNAFINNIVVKRMKGVEHSKVEKEYIIS